MTTGFGRQFEVMFRQQDAGDAPIGSTIDLARSWPDPQFLNIPNLGKEVLSIPGRIIDFGRKVGETTQVDEAIGTIFNEVYLAWSGVEQQRQGKPGLFAQGAGQVGRLFGAPPTEAGDISINRGLGILGGSVASGFQAGPDSFADLWKRSRDRTAGQMILEEGLGMYDWEEADQLTARAGTAYNLITGSFDAALGWFLAPDVLLGKAAKLGRARWVEPTVESYKARMLALHTRRTGMEVVSNEGDQGISGALNLQVRNAQGQQVYHVTRASHYAQMRHNGIMQFPVGVDAQVAANRHLAQTVEQLQGMGFDPQGNTFREAIERHRVERGGEAMERPEEVLATEQGVQSSAEMNAINNVWMAVMRELHVSGLPEDHQLWNSIQRGEPITSDGINMLMTYADLSARKRQSGVGRTPNDPFPSLRPEDSQAFMARAIYILEDARAASEIREATVVRTPKTEADIQAERDLQGGVHAVDRLQEELDELAADRQRLLDHWDTQEVEFARLDKEIKAVDERMAGALKDHDDLTAEMMERGQLLDTAMRNKEALESELDIARSEGASEDTLHAIDNKLDESVSEIGRLSQEVADLQDRIDAIADHFNELSHKVDELNDQVDLQTELRAADFEAFETELPMEEAFVRGQMEEARTNFTGGSGGGLSFLAAQRGRQMDPSHPIYLLGESDFPEVMRYAASLYRANPYDPPVIIKLNPNGLPVYFEDYLNPLALDPRSGLPVDASMVTEVSQLKPEHIVEVLHPNEFELTTEAQLLDGHTSFDPFTPGGRLHDRLYEGDGTPYEPGDIISLADVQDTLRAATMLWEQNPEMAARFLRRRVIQQRAPNNNTTGEVMAQSRAFTQLINVMDGKSPDWIRRNLFPDHVHGAILSDALGNAKTYEERRATLLAAMGIDDPIIETLAPIARARMELLTEDLKRRFPGGEQGIRARYLEDLEIGMLTSSLSSQVRQFTAAQGAYRAEINELVRLEKLDVQLQFFRDTAPIRMMPRRSWGGRLSEPIRTTNWYQTSPMARPIRTVIEYKPRQFLNLHDPAGDVQLVRQLEEAAPLGISADEVSKYRNEYMSAANEAQRNMVLGRAEALIMKRAQAISGLNDTDWAKVVQAMLHGKRTVTDHLRSRTYDGKGRDLVTYLDDDTGEAVEMALPMLGTQLQNWVSLTDVRALIKASKASGRIMNRASRAGQNAAEEILDSFYHLWKPAVLLRGGWPIRVVADEQLRILAKTGSLIQMLGAVSTGEQIHIRGMMTGVSAGTRAGRAVTAPAAVVTSAIQKLLTRAGRGAERLHLIDPEKMRLMRDAGTEKLASSRASYGGPHESILREMESTLGRYQAGALDHFLTRATGEFTSIGKRDRQYGDAWRRVLKDQLGRDPFAKAILRQVRINQVAGRDPMLNVREAAIDFLTKNKEYQDRLPWRASSLDEWSEDVVGMIQDYTGNFQTSLVKAIDEGTVNIDLLETIPSHLRPDTVHAEIIDQALGTSVVTQFMRDMLSSSFDFLGRLPTDTLSRQPFFRWSYADEMQRLFRVAESEGRNLTVSSVARMNRSARDYALDQVKTHLYDLAETSRFGHMTRFFFPFFSAWQEVLQVWSGLAKVDPSIIARALQIWRAPNKAGIITEDDEGNEFLTFVMSEQMADKMKLTGWQRYVATGGVRFGKNSFNMVTNSPLPGFGPVVQVPVNELVVKRPELESMLQFVLPLGARAGVTAWDRAFNVTMSPIIKRAEAYLTGIDQDQVYQRYFIDAVTWLDMRYRSGESSMPPTLDEAHNIAGKIYTIRTFANLSAPAQPIFDSPLKPYMDAYRDLIEMYGPEDADEKFLQTFGEEFFAVTISRTVSETGIPATIEATVARREYETLIQKYPEYGRLILGEDQSLGEFSTAAFAWQLSKRLNPDDPFSDAERDYREIELTESGSIVEVDRRLGWMEYIRGLDLIEAVRKSRGLPNLRVAGARDLVLIKQALTEKLAEQYPGWWEDFNIRDDLKWQKKIEALRGIANNPLIDDDPTRTDFEGVQQYLSAREIILQELNTRRQLGGSATLDSVANQDLANLWDTIVFKILDDNVAFAPIYFRYLEGDPVSLNG